MRKGWVYNKKTGSWKREHQSKISNKELTYDPKTGSFAKGSSKKRVKSKKTKSKKSSPEDKSHIDWVDKWGKREETNKVPDYVPQEEKTDTKKDGGNVWNVLGPILGIVALIFWAFVIFDLGKSGFKKGTKYLDNRNDKKEYCAERAEDASNSYAAKKIYKACMSN